MKFMINFDTCDSAWCKKVQPSVVEAIDNYFKENTKDFTKFLSSSFMDRPAVSTSWVQLTPEQEVVFKQAIQELPSRFTMCSAMNCFEKHGLKECFSLPPTNYRFICRHTLWELDENFNPIYKDPELRND